MATILIVDDEYDLAGRLEFNCRQAGHHPLLAHSAAEALDLLERQSVDLVLLDVMLPDLSGHEVCRRIKCRPHTEGVPVMMISARGEEQQRTKGFESGADDYLTKPFSMRELMLRVAALLKRSTQLHGRTPLHVRVGALSIDLVAHRAYSGEAEVQLTVLEFKLLHELMLQAGRALTRENLLKEVWQASGELTTRTVDTHMMRLREKLGVARDQVETVRGVGYRLSPELTARS
jgi:two-component system phosphate regulon response regulator PhoB